MNELIESAEWSALSYEEKNKVLFLNQKRTLDQFLERGAISQEQHDKSLHDLTEKMWIEKKAKGKYYSVTRAFSNEYNSD